MKTVTKTRKFTQYDAKEVDVRLLKKATIVMFDGLELEDPESVRWENKRVRISDWHKGLVNWNAEKKCYELHYYMTVSDIGQFKGILVEESA